jgi:hypothetical protein
MRGDVYFAVLPGWDMQDSPAKFHDEIWFSVKGMARYTYRLEGPARDLSCAELFEQYKAGRLSPSNVVGADYGGRY